MPGLTISSDSTALASLRQTFRTYAAWNQRDSAGLFIDQARKLATELYVQTAAIAPSKSEIAADVKALGWKIPRKFRDGRLGRGVPAQWLGSALARRAKKRGRKSKLSLAEEEAFMAQRPTLEQMQAFVIANRSSARLYLASGWLGAVADLGGSLKNTSGKIDRSRGGATIRRGAGSISVEFWNRTPGIETMDAKKHFVAKAIAVRMIDMQAYIARKRAEELQRLKAA